MRSISLFALVASLVLGSLAGAEECPTQARLKKVQGQVSRLLESWKGATAQQAKLTPTQQAELAASLQTTAQSCPVGSRIRMTLGFVRDSLAAAVEAEQTLSKTCSGDVDDASKDANVAELVSARAKLLGDLRLLASYAAGPSGTEPVNVSTTPACEKAGAKVAVTAKKGFCENSALALAKTVRGSGCEKSAAKALIVGVPSLQCEKSAAALVKSVKGAGCEKSAAALIVKAATPACKEDCDPACKAACEQARTAVTAKKGAACEASRGAALTAVSTGLVASWKKAEQEWEALSTVQRTQIGDRFAALAGRSEAVRLLPQTTKSLVAGVEVLDEITRHLEKYVAANSELQKRMPSEAKTAFKEQIQRIREANEILQSVNRILGKTTAAGAKPRTF